MAYIADDDGNLPQDFLRVSGLKSPSAEHLAQFLGGPGPPRSIEQAFLRHFVLVLLFCCQRLVH